MKYELKIDYKLLSIIINVAQIIIYKPYLVFHFVVTPIILKQSLHVNH